MATSDTDLLLINDGSKTETITIAEVRDVSMLNDTDLFLVNDGTKTETITWLELSDELGPKGTVDTPTVLKPEDGAGSGTTLYLKSDAITSVDSGGVTSTETSTITNVTDVPISSTLGLRAAWSGYGGTPWQSTDSWSLLSLSTNFGGDSGTKGYSQEAIVTSPYTFSAADFGCGIRGANGWALWFPEVVTVQLDFSIGYTGVFVTTCQSDSQTVDEGVRTGFTGAIMNLTGKVFFVDAGGSPSFPFKSVSWTGSNQLLELTDDTNLDQFNAGDEVQNSGLVVSKDATSTPPTMTVVGGNWYGSDGSGIPGGETKIIKSTVYDTTLTVAGPTDLDNAAFTGGCFLSDGTPVDGPYTQAPYKLVTSQITNVGGQVITTSGATPDIGSVENLYSTSKANPYAGAIDYLSCGLNGGGTFRVVFSTPVSGNVVVWANWASGSTSNSLSGDGGATTVAGVAQDGLIAPYNMGTVSGMTYIEITGTSSINIWGIVIDGNNIDGGQIVLTFNDPCPDLQYFKVDDVVQTTPDEVKVIAPPDVANRKLTVDGGNWDGGSQNVSDWSTQGTLTNTGAGTANYAGMFNADTREGELLTVGEMFASGSGWYVDGAQYQAASGERSGLNWSFSNKVEIVAWSARDTGTEAQAGKVYINGTEVTAAIHSDTGTSSTITKNDVTSLLPFGTTEINSIKIERPINSPANFSVFGIYLDDKLLTDTAFAGADHVEYQTKGGQGNIIGVDLANNKVFIQKTGDRDNRWIDNTNQAGTDFFIAGPQIVDSPLLTTDVELQSSPFATTPVGVDGLQGIVWNLNGIDQPMTLLNPYKPTGLTTNTTYNVKVKHVANVIGESEWSATTTFTTGVSRSLVEHYTTQITALQVALAEATGDP